LAGTSNVNIQIREHCIDKSFGRRIIKGRKIHLQLPVARQSTFLLYVSVIVSTTRQSFEREADAHGHITTLVVYNAPPNALAQVIFYPDGY